MGAYPEPEQAVRNLDGECAMVKPDSRRPETPGLLESKGRVMGIVLQNLEGLIGKRPNFRVEIIVGLPKRRSRAVYHRSVERFSAKSFKARPAITSSLPAFTSS